MMKKNFLYILLAATLFAGCEKNDGPVPDDVKLERVPQPQIVKNGGDVAIDILNLANFQGKFDLVGVYFKDDIPPSKMDVVIRKNNNNANVKVIQAGVTTYPATFTLTSAQLAQIFNSPVVLNDTYEISADVYTQDGKKYEAFPNVPGANRGWGSSINGQPGASPSIIYSAICAYDPEIYQGNFIATDQWDADGATIVLTKISDTRFSFIYPSVKDPVPVVIAVDPLTNSISIPGAPLTIGSRWSPDPPYNYPNIALYTNASLNSATGTVLPCDKKVTLSIQWGVGGGSLQFGGGPYTLTLTKM